LAAAVAADLLWLLAFVNATTACWLRQHHDIVEDADLH
jgi:hypothetical protein